MLRKVIRRMTSKLNPFLTFGISQNDLFHSFIIVLSKQRLIARITYDFLSFGYQSLVLVQVRDTRTKPHLKITDRLCDLHNHQLWQHRN